MNHDHMNLTDDLLAHLESVLPLAEEEARALRDMQSNESEEAFANSAWDKIEQARAAIARAKGE